MTTETERTALVERHALALMDDGSPSGPDECRYVTLAMVRSTIAAAVADALASAPSAPLPDNRDLALAIIKRCADYVRGYMVPPPAAAEYSDKVEWLRFQDCAHLLEAQPNAILATTDVQPSSPSQGQERTALIERIRRVIDRPRRCDCGDCNACVMDRLLADAFEAIS
jgi:hypothetical protein